MGTVIPNEPVTAPDSYCGIDEHGVRCSLLPENWSAPLGSGIQGWHCLPLEMRPIKSWYQALDFCSILRALNPLSNGGHQPRICWLHNLTAPVWKRLHMLVYVAYGRGEVTGESWTAVFQLTGEIVDSKCYFGVMNPGNGKVHRDCAVRCISGGIPPAFLVRDANGQTVTLLLANWKPELLNHIAEPITIRGRLSRSSGRLTLYAE